jgi:ABC-type Co2+ transport system permease subunit
MPAAALRQGDQSLTLDGTAVTASADTINKGVAAPAAGYRIARGYAAALDGSNPTPIATGLTTITAACVTLRGTAAPGDNTSVLTVDYTGSDGTLNVYAWKNTGGTDPTLVASTGTETFDWIAVGT